MTDSSNLPHGLIATLRESVTQYGMFAPGQTVVVGVSGGPDSTALLHALAGLRNEWQLSLVACHLNHCFRGEEAEGDAAYVRALCDRLGVACRVESVDVPGVARRRHLSNQQAARDVRHAFLRRVALDVNADRIALAHTRNDRTETVLLNILRGSGLDGVAGFAPVALPLVRPLYDTSRAQVEAYCAHHDLQPRLDSSNLKTAYRRNRVRLELLPQLRQNYNPHVDDALLRLADLARDDDALLQTLAADTLDALLAHHAPASTDSLILPAHALNALPLALRRRVVRLAIARVRGHLQDVDFQAVDNLLEAAQGLRDYQAILPVSNASSDGLPNDPHDPLAGSSVVLCCRNPHVEVRRAKVSMSILPWSVSLNIPGRTETPAVGVTIWGATGNLADLIGAANQWREANKPGVDAHNVDRSGSQFYTALYLWARRDVTLPLLARARLPGDRMRPRGLNGTKKLQDIFTDAKTPREQRVKIPVIVEANGQGRILVVGNLRVDETAIVAVQASPMQGGWGAWMAKVEEQITNSASLYVSPVGLDPAQELLALMLEYQI